MKTNYKLPTELDKQNDPLSRERLIQALALALLQDPEAAIEMAGCEVARFVLAAGPIVRKLSDYFKYTFTDNDLREVHWHLRRHIAGVARIKGLPVLPIRGGKIQGLTVQ